MRVKELILQISSQTSELVKINELMREVGINIVAIYLKNTTSRAYFMHFVPDNFEKAINVLTNEGFTVEIAEVLAAEIPFHAGGLCAILAPLKRQGINVEYFYSCMQAKKASIILLGIVTYQIKEAEEALKRDWIRLYGEELYNI